MSNTPLLDRFLVGYRKAATHSADIALTLMLEQHAEVIEPLFAQLDPAWLHKAFRQTDVTDTASTDMVIWHLIHLAPMFWDELQYFWGKLEQRERKNRIGVLEVERDELKEVLQDLMDWTVRNVDAPDCEPYNRATRLLNQIGG